MALTDAAVMRSPTSSIAPAVLLFLSINLCLGRANTAPSGSHHVNASIVPRILHPSSESVLNNVKVQVSVTGHDFWQGGQLLLVLDHGVQGLVVPASGVVDLGIVAAGRLVAQVVHRPPCCL